MERPPDKPNAPDDNRTAADQREPEQRLKKSIIIPAHQMNTPSVDTHKHARIR